MTPILMGVVLAGTAAAVVAEDEPAAGVGVAVVVDFLLEEHAATSVIAAKPTTTALSRDRQVIRLSPFCGPPLREIASEEATSGAVSPRAGALSIQPAVPD